MSCHDAKEMVDDSTLVVVVDTNKPSYTECEDLAAYGEDDRWSWTITARAAK